MSEVRIPLLDLSAEIEKLWDELNTAIQGVLRSGRFILGPNVKVFEEEMAAYLGVRHAVGVSSGTDALLIGLRALGVGPGDEVITTPFTFIATADTVSRLGATPVFVDIDPVTFNLNAGLIEECISARTKAVVPVHLYGHAAEMDAILAIAHEHGLKVLEDVAQAAGGEYKGRKLGSLGDAGAFSFFPAKNLGAFGDAGLIATDDDELAEKARMLRVHGARKKYFNEVIGYKARLDELQAAALRVKLPRLDVANEGRRRAAVRYRELLADVPGIVLPRELPGVKHVYHQYTIRVLGGRRDGLQADLKEAGVASAVYYPVPLHRTPLYGGAGYNLPEAERVSAEVVSLPIWPQIPRDVQEEVAASLRRALT